MSTVSPVLTTPPTGGNNSASSPSSVPPTTFNVPTSAMGASTSAVDLATTTSANTTPASTQPTTTSSALPRLSLPPPFAQAGIDLIVYVASTATSTPPTLHCLEGCTDTSDIALEAVPLGLWRADIPGRIVTGPSLVLQARRHDPDVDGPPVTIPVVGTSDVTFPTGGLVAQAPISFAPGTRANELGLEVSADAGPPSLCYDDASRTLTILDPLNGRLSLTNLDDGSHEVISSTLIDGGALDIIPVAGGTSFLVADYHSKRDTVAGRYGTGLRLAHISKTSQSTLFDEVIPFNTPLNTRLLYDPAADILWAVLASGELASAATGLLSGTPTFVPDQLRRPWLTTTSHQPTGFDVTYGQATIHFPTSAYVLNALEYTVTNDGALWFTVGFDGPPGTSDLYLLRFDAATGSAIATHIDYPPPIHLTVRTMVADGSHAVVYSGKGKAIFTVYAVSG